MPKDHNLKIGRWGEGLAEEYLAGKGFRPVGRNVRTGCGEIDLIMETDNLLLFIEVKTRTRLGFGFPEESVTEIKSEHFLDAVDEYLQTCPDSNRDWRIDVIAIYGSQDSREKPQIRWFQDAIS